MMEKERCSEATYIKVDVCRACSRVWRTGHANRPGVQRHPQGVHRQYHTLSRDTDSLQQAEQVVRAHAKAIEAAILKHCKSSNDSKIPKAPKASKAPTVMKRGFLNNPSRSQSGASTSQPKAPAAPSVRTSMPPEQLGKDGPLNIGVRACVRHDSAAKYYVVAVPHPHSLQGPYAQVRFSNISMIRGRFHPTSLVADLQAWTAREAFARRPVSFCMFGSPMMYGWLLVHVVYTTSLFTD